MLVQDTQEKPVLGNVGTSTEFSIKATAKSFTILSSTLYSNKIKAIVQELGANAKDSHKQAGKEDVPFEVHLPTRFEPHFSIRDFGTGLSHDEVCQIYTTYFASTKTNSNDYVGALGLGSKTPFSYTSNFTVTAIKDGRKGIYTAYINDHGVPCIALMVDHQTDECNGVEISFAVTSVNDMETFYNEAKNVYKYFKVIPTITGRQSANIDPIGYLEQDLIPGVHILFRRTSSEPSIALMGDIAYPIDAQQFDDQYRTYLKCGICIEFNIGDLDIQANREGLSYIPLTKTSIQEKINALAQALVGKFKTEIEAIPNMWDRYKYYAEKRTTGVWAHALNVYVDSIRNTDSSSIFSGWINLEEENVAPYHVMINIQRLSSNTYTKSRHMSVKVDERVLFVIDDVKRGGIKLAKHHASQTRIPNIVVISPKDNQARIEDFVAEKLMSPHSIVKASDILLPKAPSVKYEAKEVFSIVYDYNNRVGRYQVHFIEYSSFENDPLKQYLYIPITNATMEFSRRAGLDKTEFMKLITSAKIHGDRYHVFALRKKGQETYGMLSNWTKFEDFIVNYYTNITDDDILARCVIESNVLTSLTKINLTHDVSSSNIKKIIDIRDKVSKLSNKSTADFLRLARAFLDDHEHKKFMARVEQQQKYIDDIFKTYPLIKAMANLSSWNYDPEHVAHYIKMVDFYQNNSGE